VTAFGTITLMCEGQLATGVTCLRSFEASTADLGEARGLAAKLGWTTRKRFHELHDFCVACSTRRRRG
jgi:hypothetical protein